MRYTDLEVAAQVHANVGQQWNEPALIGYVHSGSVTGACLAPCGRFSNTTTLS